MRVRDDAGRCLGEADRVQERLDGRPLRRGVPHDGGLGEDAGHVVVPGAVVVQHGDQGSQAQLHQVRRFQPGQPGTARLDQHPPVRAVQPRGRVALGEDGELPGRLAERAGEGDQIVHDGECHAGSRTTGRSLP
jgi:hypothetical protein